MIIFLITIVVSMHVTSQDSNMVYLSDLEAEVDSLQFIEHSLRTILISLKLNAEMQKSDARFKPEGFYLKLGNGSQILMPSDLRIVGSKSGTVRIYVLSSVSDPKNAAYLAEELQNLYQFSPDIVFRSAQTLSSPSVHNSSTVRSVSTCIKMKDVNMEASIPVLKEEDIQVEPRLIMKSNKTMYIDED